MFKQLIRTCSASDVNTEADGEESLQLFAEFFGLLQSGRAVRRDEIQGLEWFFIQVGGFRFDHLNGHDSKRPDINLWAILLLLDDFGCHPVRRTNHSCTL